MVLYFGEGLRLGYYHYSLTEVSGEFFFKLRFLDPCSGDCYYGVRPRTLYLIFKALQMI